MTASLAKRKLRVEPAWSHLPEWHYTYGPAVADLCANAGLVPDPEQELILDATFAVGHNGLSAAFEIDVIAARQQLKTASITMMELGWIYVTDQRTILHTAHRIFAVQGAFRNLRRIITGSPELSKRLAPGRAKGMKAGNNELSVEFSTGQIILLGTRTGDTGRSESVDKLVIDEAYDEDEEDTGAILPTIGAVPDPQVVRASSAGLLKSRVLRGVRDRGRAGIDPRQAYFEWGDREAWSGCGEEACDHALTRIDCALDDESRWERIMSALDVRTSRETIRGFRNSMTPEMFARELMVWWFDPPKLGGGGVFGDSWAECALEVGERPDAEWLAIEVSLDRSSTSFSSSGHWDDGRVNLSAVNRMRGTDGVAAEAKRIQADHGCMIVVDGRGPGADLTTELDDLGVMYVLATSDDVLAASAGLYDGVTRTLEADGSPVPAPTVTHMDDPELNDAVDGAVKQFVGDRFTFGRKASTSDVSMLRAAALAHWGATTNPVPELQVFSFADLDACDACGEHIDHDVDDGDYRCRRCIDEGREARTDG